MILTVILSVDPGKARTGIAICDKSEMLASPVCVIKEYHEDALVKKICEIASKKGAELIVVGLPLNMDGSEGESAKNARYLAESISSASGLPFQMQDERGTTITASGYLNENNVRGKKRKDITDAVASVIILEDFLRKRKNSL